MKVKEKVYVQSNVMSSKDGEAWVPAKPMLYSPNLFEKVRHAWGNHWSFGQPFCVICGKEFIDET